MSTLDKNKQYTIDEAAVMLPGLSTSKFIGSVDLDIVLDVSEKHKKTNVAGSVSLPHQVGDHKKVIVFAEGDDAKNAEKAGAFATGLDSLVKQVEDGSIEFDVAVATPAVMPKIAKLGKVLGPKGLMPNPNNGTVTSDVESTVTEFVAGKLNFKKSEQQTIRAKVAKVDMSAEQIAANIKAYLKAVLSEAKKVGPAPFKKITVSPTMGAAVRLNINSVMEDIA